MSTELFPLRLPVLNVLAQLLFLPAALLITGSAAAATLVPFEASYNIENDYITGGIATLRLVADDEGGVQFSLKSRPTGIFKWTKNGNITELATLSSLEPPFVASQYSYIDKGRPERSYNIRFDRSAGNFELTKDNKATVLPIEPTALDRLSVTLALLREASENPDFKRLEVQALDGRQEETVVFINRGEETVDTDLGQFKSIRVLKERLAGNRETIIWLAPPAAVPIQLPIQIEQYKKGKLSLRLTITGVKLLD